MTDFPTPEKLRHQVADIREVGTLPHVMLRILDIVADERSSAADLADAIATDTSLTAKILKIVNSAFYGFYREIALVADAVVVLGFEEIKRISLAISVVGMLGGKSARDERRLRFWHHCFQTAALADLIERDLTRGSQGAFTAGLLHDIGRALLDQHFPDMFAAIAAEEAATHRTTAEVERALLGVDHGEIGFWLADGWNLPPQLAEAIRFHHAPDLATEGARLAATVHIADTMVHWANDVAEDAPPDREIQEAALAMLGTDLAHLQALQAEWATRMTDSDAAAADLITP